MLMWMSAVSKVSYYFVLDVTENTRNSFAIGIADIFVKEAFF